MIVKSVVIVKDDNAPRQCESTLKLRFLDDDGQEAYSTTVRCAQYVGGNHLATHTFNLTGETWSAIFWRQD